MNAKEELLRRILVPINGSFSSLMAQEITVIIAKKTNATITVLHFIEELRLGQSHHDVMGELVGHLEQEAKKILNDTCALFSEEGLNVDTKILRGCDPADTILELSDNYDLIIIGAHGEKEKDPYMLGSVTKKVIQHAMCPVLITKKVTSLSNLLICVDGSKNSIRAFKWAAKLAEKFGSNITLLNVQGSHIYDFSPTVAKDLGELALSGALNAIRENALKVNKKLEFGIPSDKIVEVAEKGNYDLIVLGSRGLGTVERLLFGSVNNNVSQGSLLGSVSDDVSHKAKCSVLIVPAKS